ncbi:MAG: hypothetical protein HQL25_04260 [Candidatus Omnitrophica bacterium]|nr:hypothetical protein [Candidatus Omnitrophota bacterium]
MNLLDKIGFAAAVILPLFNIPLILRMIERKSSQDVSLVWAVGVWVCILLMAPSGFQSKDMVWRVFNVMNVVFFSAVALTTLNFRRKKYAQK